MSLSDAVLPVEAALAGIFPAGTATAVERIGAPGAHALFPEERAAVADAVPGRQAEFAAGRTAARRALLALGLSPTPIPAGADRAPLWPSGIGGSLAHAGGLAAAAARLGRPLGLDLERDVALEPALWPEICSEEELAALAGGPCGSRVARVFAAKEAVYKAQYAVTGRLIGFRALSVRLTSGGFTACFTETVGPFARGDILEGRMAAAGGMVVAGVAL